MIVSPLLMLSFVGFSLKTSNTLSLIPRVWCGIVAARILRKVISMMYIIVSLCILTYQPYDDSGVAEHFFSSL